MSKEIVFTGATGLIGRKLFYTLRNKGYSVKVFTRNPEQAKQVITGAAKYVYWDYNNPESWQKEINGVYGIIHMAGANLFAKRWTNEYKKVIRESRITSTKNIVSAIDISTHKPKVFVCASAVGYYGDNGDRLLDENTSSGNDYLAQVCRDWEIEALKAKEFNVRVASMRTGIVLSQEDGAFPLMKKAFNFFVGGPLGSGTQYFPWIHIDDVVNAYLFAIEKDSLNGGININAPESVTMNEFAKKLGEKMHRPSVFRVPGFVLNLVLGEFGKSIIASQRAAANKLLENGFKFEFEHLTDALRDLLKD